MASSPKADQIRHFVCCAFESLGAPTGKRPYESILIRKGIYCGRSFRCDGLTAVWFAEEDEVKVYQRDGSVAQVASVGASRASAPAVVARAA